MRENNFDLLRLLAALGVFFAHGSFLYDRTQPVFFDNTYSLGSLSVYVFFFISGHLTFQSWHRAPRWPLFAAKRALRIFPGLMVAAGFSVFAVGTLATHLDRADFLSSPRTWGLFANYASALATHHDLPGVFEHLPFPSVVNGSLWTIKYEITMYFILAICGMLGLLTRWRLALLIACCVAAFWAQLSLPLPDSLVAWSDFWQFSVVFLSGALCNYLPRQQHRWMLVPLLLGLVLSCTGSTAAAIRCGAFLWLPSLIWLIAYYRPLTRIHLRHDLSYGIYIYAFPVQQAITEVSLAHGLSKAVCLALSLALVLLLAMLSWLYIERPAIAWSRTIGRSPV